MTVHEALRRLGLVGRPSAREIDHAYRRLMAIVDPTIGGIPQQGITAALRQARETALAERRRQQLDTRVLAIGGLFLVVALVLAVALTYVRPAPGETPGSAFDHDQSIGLAVAGAELASSPSSFHVSTNVTVHAGLLGCGEAEVTAVFEPTSGFWKAFGRSMPSRVRFAIGFGGDSVRDVEAFTVRFSAAIDPVELGNYAVNTLTEPVDQHAFRAATSSAQLDRPRSDLIGTVVTGTLYRWNRTWAPLVVHFRADWTHQRSLGTCFVNLPSVTSGFGASTAGEALQEETRSKLTSLATGTDGATGLELAGGRLLADNTNPTPQRGLAADIYRWGCSTVEDVYGQLARKLPVSITSPDGSGEATRPPPAGARAADCAALAVISTPNAEAIRSAMLFLLGALASLGCQMLYDGFRRRHG